MYRASSMTLRHEPTRAITIPRTDAWQVWSGAALVSLVVFVHEAVFRASTVEQLDFDVQILSRLVICGACGLYGLLHLDRIAIYLGRFPGSLSVLLCLWAMLTMTAAVNVNYTAASTAALCCVTLFAPAVLHVVGGRRLAQVVLWTLVVYLLASWAAHFTWPELTLDETDDPSSMFGWRRVGGLHSYNGLGRQAALALGLALALGVVGAHRWRLLAGPILLSIVTLVGTDSRTAILSALAAVGVASAETLSGKAKWALAGGGLFLAALAGLAVVNLSSNLNLDELMAGAARSGDPMEMYHLTGRIELWEFALEKIEQSPLLGCGWGGARFLLIDGHFATHHAHNMLLNVTLSAGVVGGVIVAAMLIWQLLTAVARPDLFPDMLAVLVLVGGIGDQMMFSPIPDSHTLLWLVSLHWRAMGSSLLADGVEPAWSLA